MTNYNDGLWHTWTGSECPVHPKSLVEYVWHDPNYKKAGIGHARQSVEDDDVPKLAWAHVVKFRVVKEYREPREFWIVQQTGDAYSTYNIACSAASTLGLSEPIIIHVREVLE